MKRPQTTRNVFVNMATDYTREWIQFFSGCGIPKDVATSYGLIFNENRIQKNMLLDLNKEYLRDMGITVMGDIIAILRHAKVVHDKLVREQILSEPGETLALEAFESTESSPSSRPATPMKRLLEHYTRKYEPSGIGIPGEEMKIQIENDVSLSTKKMAHRIGGQGKIGVKKKIEAPSSRSDHLVPGKLEVPVPKSRRVLPENEGSYTIKMPSGTTERSKKLLEKAKTKQSKTVFDRLGESSVSSTSDVTSSPGTGTSILQGKSIREKNNLSVFSRLGEKSQLVTSTSSNGETSDLLDQLPYRGILKSPSKRNKPRGSPNSTMRADNESHVGKGGVGKAKKINAVKERLGTNVKAKDPSPLSVGMKMNRLQITTTFEEDQEPLPPTQSLSKRFNSIQRAAESTVEKNLLDGLGSFRSEKMRNRAKVSSTTQSSDIKRGVKRRLEEPIKMETDPPDASQSKKVRFGQTTHCLIPGNPTESTPPPEYQNLTMVIGNEKKPRTLTSGVRVGPLNSDKMRQRLTLKERIGTGSLLSRTGKMATDVRRRRSLKFAARTKKPVTIHDRLG